MQQIPQSRQRESPRGRTGTHCCVKLRGRQSSSPAPLQCTLQIIGPYVCLANTENTTVSTLFNSWNLDDKRSFLDYGEAKRWFCYLVKLFLAPTKLGRICAVALLNTLVLHLVAVCSESQLPYAQTDRRTAPRRRSSVRSVAASLACLSSDGLSRQAERGALVFSLKQQQNFCWQEGKVCVRVRGRWSVCLPTTTHGGVSETVGFFS